MKLKIGLYFGSFNPIHIGHLAIANYMAEYSDLDQIWFVVSPQNPFKQKGSLLSDYHRLELVNRSIEKYPKLKASNIEFGLPKPSYTIDTLTYLKEKHQEYDFSLIMGSDNLKSFEKWKNYELILKEHDLYVYPRPGFKDEEVALNGTIHLIKAPLMEISSSFIREAIKEKKEIPFFMPESAYNYLKEMHFYEK
ncbi:nicotinate (nicotinamide) nucleotide adenylyltransferase [Marinifilum caeruleilacunae]|uniref:Probable nicotinate-nucleotide adenylyltransferase n=1 Tax=Marinifilum caeruleilacunae TaxID=2499076 RepID=A0ABX1WUD9_9BACT|nr:nicotinate (nicotinamide) nucleotide adenylyltransferase [Marinifilum caeruleilacunae]NOU59555.1 nicotinate-nucleotide adenylyltransferase [Marinifilum caeruleilacunae]